MLPLLLALVALALSSVDLLQGQPRQAGGALRWAPPELSHPLSVEVGAEGGYFGLDPDRDYEVRLPAEPVAPIDIDGGRNVVIIGGAITIPDDGSSNAGLRIFNSTGTVHIEGIAIRGSDVADADGIDIAAPDAEVQLENIRITGINGSFAGEHADLLQTYGGAKELRIDRFTGISSYQGFFLRDNEESGTAVGHVELRHVNLESSRDPRSGDGAENLLWWTTGCDGPSANLTEVYLSPSLPEGRSLGYAVYPQVEAWGGSDACLAAEEAGGTRVSWPVLPIDGHVELGPPPGGDFVLERALGAAYTSPGYLDPG